jgi:hypothetical protein
MITDDGYDDEDNSIPDLIELNDWMVECEPAYYAAIKYLPGISFCRLARKLWELRGRPDIRGPAAT